MADKVTIRRTPDEEGDLCGSKGAAEILGVEKTRISRYQKMGVMPPKVAQFPNGPIWLRRDVEALKRRRDEAEAKAA